jgi:16S rRNA G966 N2-methylase RsmD
MNALPPDTSPALSLDALAANINANHSAAECTARTALDYARAAGDELLLAKAQVEHGQWLHWLAANCPRMSERTARAYMRLARNWETLESKTADTADLTLDGALKLLAAPDTDMPGDLLEPCTADVSGMLGQLSIQEQRVVIASVAPVAATLVANNIRRERGEQKRNERLAQYPADTPLDADNVRILVRDLRLLTDADIPDASVDVIITDPPYPAEFIGLFDALGELAARVLKPGGALVAMTGQTYLPDYLRLLSQHLTYRWTLAYHMPGHSVQVWPVQTLNQWKPLLWFSKDKPSLTHWVNDYMASPLADKDKEHHDWGQSLPGMEAIVSRFSNPGDLVLDPFLGGGTTGAACLAQGRRFIGVEIDDAIARLAAGRIQAQAA